MKYSICSTPKSVFGTVQEDDVSFDYVVYLVLKSASQILADSTKRIDVKIVTKLVRMLKVGVPTILFNDHEITLTKS